VTKVVDRIYISNMKASSSGESSAGQVSGRVRWKAKEE